MRHEVLWNLLVALFVWGLLLSGLGSPAQAGDFNPQPEPPAAEMKPDVEQPVQEKAIDPGDDERLAHPTEREVESPGKDKPARKPPLRKRDTGDGGVPSNTLLH